MLTKVTLEDLNMLINITRSMYRNLKELCNMEIARQKDSKEFFALIEEIKGDILIKNNCFDRITDTPEKCLEVVDYLKKEVFKSSRFSNAPALAFIVAMDNLEEDDMVLGHILNQLSKKILDNTEYMASSQAKMFSLPQELTKTSEKFYAFQNTLQSYLMIDMYILLLSLNERRINTHPNQTIKASAIKTKYRLGLLVPGLLNELLNQKLAASLNPFLINATASKMYQVPEELESLTRETFLLNQAEKCFNMIRLYNDEELINPENMAYVLNIQDMYRAILILSDPEIEEKALEKIKKYLEFLSNITEPHNKRMSQRIFTDIITMRTEDKTIPQIISFGRI